jgi:hypothetical protein
MPRATAGIDVCFTFQEVEVDGKWKTKSTCNYCGKLFGYKVTGTKGVAHLLGLEKVSVDKCTFSIKPLPPELKASLSMATTAARADTKAKLPQLGFNKDGEAEPAGPRGIKRLFTENHEENANLLLANAIAAHGSVAWLFCNTPAFKAYTAYLAANQMPSYKPADRRTLSGRLFSTLIERQDKDVAEADDKSLWVTIMNDGYETAGRRHTLNSLAATRQGTWYLNSRHITIEEGGSLDKNEMIKVVAADITAVGEARCCGYVLDSPNINVGTLAQVEESCRRICGILCQTHQLSLVISKILKLPSYKKQVQEALTIAKVFRRVLFIKALLSALQFSDELKSKFPQAPKPDGYAITLFAKTRMGGVYFMLKRLVFLKPVLQACVVHIKFTDKYGAALAALERDAAAEIEESSDEELDGSQSKETSKILRIKHSKELILDETWWSAIEMTCSLLSVLVDKMKETDHSHFLTGKMRDIWLKGEVP